MKGQTSLVADIKSVNRILIDAKVVKGVVINQIRLFLNGNKASHLYARFARAYPCLWGKYPALTNTVIAKHFSSETLNPLEVKYKDFQNFDKAKVFKEADLDQLADWHTPPDELDETDVYVKETIDGYLVSFNSKPEWNTYLALKEKGFIKSFRAQSLMIPFNSYLKEKKKYFPDFVFLTPEGYLAIVESKPIIFMANFYVQAKYYALKRYCEANGFIYAMFDEHLNSIESIRHDTEENDVTLYFDHLIETARMFNDGGFDLIKHRFQKDYSVEEIKTMLAKHIVRRQLVNKSSVGYDINHLGRINYGLLEKGPTKKEQPLSTLVTAIDPSQHE